jgi:acyl-CoA thioester hydrolase
MAYHYQFRPRYIDCDAQKVMHNANYLAYVDDAVDCFFRSRLGGLEDIGFDAMVKKATVEWQAPARMHDIVDCEVRVARWGNTSFDVEVVGTNAGSPVFTAYVVNVSTTPGAPVPTPIPESVKTALSA